MSALPKVAHEEARAVELGIRCAHCGAEFVRAHQSPTACSFCFRNLSADERNDTPLAVHPEANKEAHRREAKARKQRRSK